jgi:hypothetical protein
VCKNGHDAVGKGVKRTFTSLECPHHASSPSVCVSRGQIKAFLLISCQM